MYNVVIQSVDSAHDCELSKVFFQHYSWSAGNKCTFDLKKIDALLVLLKSNPNLISIILHPLLTECIPNYFVIDVKFIVNYRARGAILHAHNLDRVRDISIHEVGKLCMKRNFSIK